VAEVDLFDGDLDGLAVVEVEFPDAGAAAAFEPPPWFGRELTGEGGWSNADLARFGRPPG
jgi:CYTH domain-containing protein